MNGRVNKVTMVAHIMRMKTGLDNGWYPEWDKRQVLRLKYSLLQLENQFKSQSVFEWGLISVLCLGIYLIRCMTTA